MLPGMGNVTGWVDRHEVDEETGCWIWQGYVMAHGYGSTAGGTSHRAYYEHYVGPIPEGMWIDHLCRNRVCCNPEHLEPVTPQENILRGTSPAAKRASMTHCTHGHEFTEANIYRPPSRPNERHCRACRVERDRARRRDRSAA